MSDTIHSTTSTSSDVLLPHPLNHVNHVNTETSPTNKSFKRSRSPSTILDNPDEINTDKSATKSRKKRNTIDIEQSLGRQISADKIHVYQWPTNELHADLYVLQEQICEYLSLKSFKRKYPDIYRRNIDLHEREHLKSQNVVTEAQCDLGLTALKLDEILQVMSTDYPDKYDEFNNVWQEKRRTFIGSNKICVNQKSTLLSASISNHLLSSTSNNQLSNSQDSADKTRPKLPITMRKKLLNSTAEYNTQLQRERLQERKACFDLQTMQIHYPSNRQFRLPPHLTEIGSYPLALLPGQHQDSYVKYSSNELKYMPINTALYYYPKPIALVNNERFCQQNASSDEEDEINSTNRPPTSNATTHQTPLLVNGINGSLSIRISKPLTPVTMNSNVALCHSCKLNNDENNEELVTCTNCHHRFHPTCIDVNDEMLNIIKTYSWQCIDCKSCVKCNKTHDEANMMFCDRCDRGYHSYCVGLESIPDGSWQCSACDPPQPSPSSSPSLNAKCKRGRPSNNNRSSPRPQQPTKSPKPEILPTRVSSRRSCKNLSNPLSPTLTTEHSISNDVQTTMNSSSSSSSMNLNLNRNQQQWSTNINNTNHSIITSTNQ